MAHSRVVVVDSYAAFDRNGCSGNFSDHPVRYFSDFFWLLLRVEGVTRFRERGGRVIEQEMKGAASITQAKNRK